MSSESAVGPIEPCGIEAPANINGEHGPEQSVYDQLGVPHVINCVGYATRIGGSAPSPAVVQAMTNAHSVFIEIDDLQAAASRIIAECTGAEAGIVTCGAGAALTLAAAACMAGNDLQRMNALPDTTDFPRNRIIYPAPHDHDYDHAIRLSGAVVDFIDFNAPDALTQIEAAISPRTAAVGYVWKRVVQQPSLQEVADLAHRHNLPLILDAAQSLPPAGNLRAHIARGADLVALSGGKHLGGPQASGLLFGRRDLVRSAWLQMVDMDVRAATWSLREWVEDGFVEGPPKHGIGRSMKVSKEAVVGLLTALQHYERRDHAAELEEWKARAAWLEPQLSAISGLTVQSLFPAPNGQPYPTLRLFSEDLTFLLNYLRGQNPKVIMAQDEVDCNVAYLFPMLVRDSELPIIVQYLRDAINVLSEQKKELVS